MAPPNPPAKAKTPAPKAPPLGPSGAPTGLSEKHFDRHAARYGRWLMIGSAIAFVFATSLIATLASLFRQELNGGGIASILYSVSLGFQAAAPFVFVAGVLLYCFGRFLAAGSITLVGFEGASSQDIAVVGPDDQNVVWIGRKFAARIDADAAAEALKQRFRPKPV